MSWHYSNGDKQVGPITEDAFEDCVRSGVIQGETLVWKEGFPNWTRFSNVSRDSHGAITALATASRCTECAREFSQDEMVNFGGTWVCASCKPLYLQKLKEGVKVGGEFAYAGFWSRFGAKFLDGILLQIVGAVLGAIVGLLAASGGPRSAAMASVIASILGFALQISYNTFLLGKYGATLGKMAIKAKVVRPDGSPVGYSRAFGRVFAEMLSGFTLGIGYLMAAWDPERRALHDRICDTRVVKA